MMPKSISDSLSICRTYDCHNNCEGKCTLNLTKAKCCLHTSKQNSVDKKTSKKLKPAISEYNDSKIELLKEHDKALYNTIVDWTKRNLMVCGGKATEVEEYEAIGYNKCLSEIRAFARELFKIEPQTLQELVDSFEGKSKEEIIEAVIKYKEKIDE